MESTDRIKELEARLAEYELSHPNPANTDYRTGLEVELSRLRINAEVNGGVNAGIPTLITDPAERADAAAELGCHKHSIDVLYAAKRAAARDRDVDDRAALQVSIDLLEAANHGYWTPSKWSYDTTHRLARRLLGECAEFTILRASKCADPVRHQRLRRRLSDLVDSARLLDDAAANALHHLTSSH